MRFSRTLALCAALLMALHALPVMAQSAEETPSMVGYWYGHDRQPNGELVQRITHQRADGTFSIVFRRYENCVLDWQQFEAGTWSVEGRIETKHTTQIDGEPADYIDTYEILDLSATGNKRLHNQTGTIFTSERVSEDFAFPDCEAII